jgi:hypothetical protein
MTRRRQSSRVRPSSTIRPIAFKLFDSSGQVTSGITWTYLVLTGTVNTFTNASGAKSISGAGTGTMTVSSLGSATVIVQITASYAGKTYLLNVTLLQDVAPPPQTGGGGGGGAGTNTLVSKTSGFTGFSTTTFVDSTGAMVGTMPTGLTTANINAQPIATPVAGTSGSWTVECKVMRDIAGTPTQIGSTQTLSSYYVAASGGDPADWGSADFLFSIADTGLTAGVSYTWRVYMRITSGTRSHNVAGSVTVTA